MSQISGSPCGVHTSETFLLGFGQYNSIATGLLVCQTNFEDNTSRPLAVFSAIRGPILVDIIVLTYVSSSVQIIFGNFDNYVMNISLFLRIIDRRGDVRYYRSCPYANN